MTFYSSPRMQQLTCAVRSFVNEIQSKIDGPQYDVDTPGRAEFISEVSEAVGRFVAAQLCPRVFKVDEEFRETKKQAWETDDGSLPLEVAQAYNQK